jgi:hypothetical protein
VRGKGKGVEIFGAHARSIEFLERATESELSGPTPTPAAFCVSFSSLSGLGISFLRFSSEWCLPVRWRGTEMVRCVRWCSGPSPSVSASRRPVLFRPWGLAWPRYVVDGAREPKGHDEGILLSRSAQVRRRLVGERRTDVPPVHIPRPPAGCLTCVPSAAWNVRW